MCGIAGIYNRDGAPVEPGVLARMSQVLDHRGPDDRGAHLWSLARREGRALPAGAGDAGDFEGGFGFTRLKILDLTEHGHQPMVSGDGRVILAFNGEIYNAFDYRPELEQAGFEFRSKTDTEVILHLYRHVGWEAMLERLNGMFAICIADLEAGCLWMARDRLGIKPLYLYERNGTVLFASEVKAFLEHPLFEARLDGNRIDEQMMFRYCAGSGGLLRGVRTLEPGCWIRVDAGGMEERRYWSIPDRRPAPRASFDDAVATLSEELAASVRRRLLADVKLGCQLSGGVDSSLITPSAAAKSGADMDAISIVFDDPRFSEKPWIERAAAGGGVRVHMFTLDNDYFFDNVERVAWHMDQPLNHPNSIGIFYIAQCAKPIVTVLLSGEGADELFGGYPRFAYAALRPRIRALLPLLRRLPAVGARIWRRFGYADGLDDTDWFITSSAFMTPEDLRRLRPDADIPSVLARRRAIFEEGTGDYIANCLRYELRTYLVDLLVRQDKMTMAHSIENRVPFLDHELVAFARGLPSDDLVRPSPGLPSMNARNTKRVLKRLAERTFDDAFVYRPKAGFALPLRSYFRDARFEALMRDALLPGIRGRGLFDARVVEEWWRDVDRLPSSTVEALWIVAAFEMWAQQFVDHKKVAIGTQPHRRQ